MPKDEYRISQATAQWLLQFCTKLVRLGTGTEWQPLFMERFDQVRKGYIDGIAEDEHLPLHIKHWIGGLMQVCKTIAGIIAYQYEPEELPKIVNAVNEVVDFGVAGFDDEVPDMTGMDDLSDLKTLDIDK